jgi:hypothetical protein
MSQVDDGSIADDWWLLRRIHPEQIVPDKMTGHPRVSSAAFRDAALSVDVEELLEKEGFDWRFSVKDHPAHSLAKIQALHPRSLQQAVVSSPLPDNAAHAEVRGHKSGSVSRALSQACLWVHRV